MGEGANAQLVRDMLAEAARGAETGEIDGWLDFFSEEIEWEAMEDAPDAGTYRGHDGIRGYFEDWMATVDNIRWEIGELSEVADSVVGDTQAMALIKGTDSEMVLDYMQVWRIAGGKIAHVKEFRERHEAVAFAEAQSSA
jgi:ketosteroid isomerase-like protein